VKLVLFYIQRTGACALISGVKRKEVKLSLYYTMKAYREVDVQTHVFLTSALVGVEWSALCPTRFTPGESAPSTHWIGGWVGLRASLDDMEK
jgi:hypothetical protein